MVSIIVGGACVGRSVVAAGADVVITVSGETTSTRGDSTFLQKVAKLWATVALNSIPPKKSFGACHVKLTGGFSSGLV